MVSIIRHDKMARSFSALVNCDFRIVSIQWMGKDMAMTRYTYDEAGASQPGAEINGVYYLVNANDHVLYVGKAFRRDGKGISSRLREHFSEKNWHRNADANRRVTHFYVKECPTEEVAFELESYEIDKYNPIYNTFGAVGYA